MYGTESVLPGMLCKPRPAVGVRRDVIDQNGLAGPKAVETRPLVVLQLEQLEQTRVLLGRGDEAQVASMVGKQQAGSVCLQQAHAVVSEAMHVLDDVVLVDKRVGELDEGLGQVLWLPHWSPPAATPFRAAL
jgi:hypothetical protein